MFISRRCDQFRWSTVFRRCRRRRRLPLVHCHLEAIFNMNTSRIQLRSSICTVDGKDIRLTAGVSLWTRFNAIFFPTVNHNTVWTIRLHITTSLKSISQKRWLYHQIFIWSFWPVQLSQCSSRDQRSSSSLVKSPSADIPLWWIISM